MSNALDDLVDKVDRLVTEMGSNLLPDETSRNWYASISAQFLAFNRSLRDAIKEERTSRLELEAFNFLEKYAETTDDKLTDSEIALKRKLLRLGSSSARQNHGRFQTFDSARRAYMFETGNPVYDKETYEKFCKWLYDKKCEDDCPYYRIVEGEGECRPRCTNPCGHCFNAREEAN